MRKVSRWASRVPGRWSVGEVWLILLGGLLALGLTGCGSRGDTPELARVRGRVTVNGQPLAGYIVNFMPTGGGTSECGGDRSGR